jgi:hypothetical protein
MSINAEVRLYVPQDAEGFSKWLADNCACRKAREWAQGKDLRTIWNTCEEGNWLCWLLAVSKYTPALDPRFYLDYNAEITLVLQRMRIKSKELSCVLSCVILSTENLQIKKHMADWIRARVPYPFGNAEEGTQVNSSALGNEEKI